MEVDDRPPPQPDDTTRFFWDGASRGELLVQRCAACGSLQYPPEVVCTTCQSEKLESARLTGRGTLYSFAVVHRAFHPSFAPHVPYVVAVVELEEQPGLRLLTNIVETDPDHLAVGIAVETVFEKRGDLTMPQFRPVKAGR